MTNNSIHVKGGVIQSFSNICISLKYIAQDKLYDVIKAIEDPDKWYPFYILTDLFSLIIDSYDEPDNLLELIGRESINIWYEKGGGKKLISQGVDFLKLQNDSSGYSSMVKGPKNQLGRFEIKQLDIENGEALIQDTTPFPQAYSKGIIIGGIIAPGDIKRVHIEYKDNDLLLVSFEQAGKYE